jgi:hypothetical protein
LLLKFDGFFFGIAGIFSSGNKFQLAYRALSVHVGVRLVQGRFLLCAESVDFLIGLAVGGF